MSRCSKKKDDEVLNHQDVHSYVTFSCTSKKRGLSGASGARNGEILVFVGEKSLSHLTSKRGLETSNANSKTDL